MSDLKKEYFQQLNLSRLELANLDHNTRFTYEGVVNAAKQKLPGLKYQLLLNLMKNAITIFVPAGLDLSSQIQEIAEENRNVAGLDFLSLEKRLLLEVYPQDKIKGYAFNNATVSMLNNALVDLRTDLGASFIPPVSASAAEYRVLSGPSEALAHLESLLERSFKGDLKKLYLAKQMNDFIESRLAESDKMVFFVSGSGNVNNLMDLTGKTTTLNSSEVEAALTGKKLQSIVVNKLKGNKKTLTKTDQNDTNNKNEEN